MDKARPNGSRENQSDAPHQSRGASDRDLRRERRRISRGQRERIFLSNEEVTKLNQRALEEAYGDSDHIAEVVRADAGQSKKAAENWLLGENPMGLTAFANAYRNNFAFRAWAKFYVLGEQDFDPIAHIQMASAVTNIAETARRLGVTPDQITQAVQFAMTAGQGLSPQPSGEERAVAVEQEKSGKSRRRG